DLGPGACIYVSKDAAHVFEGVGFVDLELDNLERRMVICPDPTGEGWAIVTSKKSGVQFGSSKLAEKLRERGWKPGRYRARIEGQAIVVEAGRSGSPRCAASKTMPCATCFRSTAARSTAAGCAG